MPVEPSPVEVELSLNTEKLEALTAAIVILLDDLKYDFERFIARLEDLKA